MQAGCRLGQPSEVGVTDSLLIAAAVQICILGWFTEKGPLLHVGVQSQGFSRGRFWCWRR